MATFYEWFQSVNEAAKTSEVGKLALANNFQVAHTGGGCLTWERQLESGHFWICDEANGLGDSLGERYLVGQYDADGEEVDEGNVASLQEAIDWVNARDK